MKTVFKQHYQQKDPNRAMTIFDENWSQVLCNNDLRKAGFPRELTIAYFEIIYEALRIYKDMYGSNAGLNIRNLSYNASKAHMKKHVDVLRQYYQTILLKTVDFDQEYDNTIRKMSEMIAKELQQLDSVGFN